MKLSNAFKSNAESSGCTQEVVGLCIAFEDPTLRDAGVRAMLVVAACKSRAETEVPTVAGCKCEGHVYYSMWHRLVVSIQCEK